MAKYWMGMVLAGLLAVGLGAGCNDNEITPTGSGGSAGNAAGGTAGSGGSAGIGGNAGADSGAGASGGAGADAGGSAGTGGADAGTDATGGAAGDAAGDAGTAPGADPIGIVVLPGAAPDAGGGTRHLLVAGTDFATTTEIASVDLASKTVTGHLSVSDGDAVPGASHGWGFVLERTNGKVDVLATNGTLARSIDVTQTGLGNSDAGTGTKAYVPLYDGNRVAVLDLDAGQVTHSLDLSGYLDASDADGSVDAANPIYDTQSGRLYLTLQRIDRTTIVAPDYQLTCPQVPSLLVAFDTATDTEVDLNGSAPGKALALTTINPVSVALDQGKLLILSAGCFKKSDGGSLRKGHGVESIDLSTGKSSILYQPGSGDFLARMLLVAHGQTIIDRFDASFAEHWNRYAVSSSTLGAKLSDVPDAVSFDGTGGLFGIVTANGDGGPSVDVVRYDLATGTDTTLLSSPWQSSVSHAAGTALVE